MKTVSEQLLVNAAGHLMHDHAFDHLPDEKINRLRLSFKKLADESTAATERRQHQHELLDICSEADLFTDEGNPQTLQQWYAVMYSLGINGNSQ